MSNLQRVGISLFTLISVVSIILAAATIWLFVTNPVTVATAVNEAEIAETAEVFSLLRKECSAFSACSDQMKGPSPNRDAGDNAVIPTRMLRAVRGGQPMERQYIGVDLHKQFFQACAMSDAGVRLWEMRFPRTEGGFLLFRARCTGNTALAVEACGPTWAFVDAVQAAVGTVCAVDPRKTRLKAGFAAKTDRLDARRLADALRRDSVVSIYVPPAAIRELREVCRGRHQVIRLRTRLAQMIRALLLRSGVADVPVRRVYSASG